MKSSLKLILQAAAFLIAGQLYCMEQDNRGLFNKIFNAIGFRPRVNPVSPNNQLRFALTKRDFVAVHEAIIQGADINYMYYDKLTPLAFATSVGDYQTVALLLNLGADQNKGVETPLSIAIQNKKQDIINLLMQFDGKITPSNKNNSLGYAIINNNERAVQQLVALGADVNAECQLNPLKIVVPYSPNKNIMRILLAAGLDDKRTIQDIKEAAEYIKSLLNDAFENNISSNIAIIEETAFENTLPLCKALLLSLRHIDHPLKTMQNSLHIEIVKHIAGEDNIKKRMAEIKLAKQNYLHSRKS